MRVVDSADGLVRKTVVPTAAGATAMTWDGRDSDGAVVPDGAVRGPDLADRRGREHRQRRSPARPRRHDARLRRRRRRPLFYPQDGDQYADHDRAGIPAAPSRDRDLDDPERRGRDRRQAARRPASRPGSSRAARRPRSAEGSGRLTGWQVHVRGDRTDALTTTTQAVAFGMNAFGSGWATPPRPAARR